MDELVRGPVLSFGPRDAVGVESTGNGTDALLELSHAYATGRGLPDISTVAVSSNRPDLGALFRRHRIAISVTFVAFLAGACAFSLLQTELYRARTVVQVEAQNHEFLNIKDVEPTVARGGDGFMSTQAKLIRTETLARRVVSKLHLTDSPIFFRHSTTATKLRRAFSLADAPLPRSESEAVGTLLNRLSVKSDADSDLITITVDTPDPQMSATLANEVANEYMDQEQEARWNNAVRVGKWLTSQLEDFRKKLQNSEEELQRYAMSASLLYTSDQNNVADDRLRQIQQDLSRAQADRAEKQAQLEIVSAATEDSLPRVMDDAPMRDLKMRLADLRRQYAELTATLTPSHYKVERVHAQITELEEELARERGVILKRIRNEYDTAVKREALLQRNYQNQAHTVADQSARAVRYNLLKREVDTNRELYSSMLQKVKGASLVSALKTNSMRVVDPANGESPRCRPSYVQNFGIALVGALMCSAVMVLGLERRDRSIREPGETSRLRLRELGTIPSARFDPNAKLLFKSGAFGPNRSKSLNPPNGSLQEPEAAEPHLVTWTNPRSVISEAFRSASVSFAQSDGSEDRCEVFVFTSPDAKTGKTTATANLAVSLAGYSRQVLVIDADLRRPMIHTVFGIPTGYGLADVLSEDKAPTGDDFERFVQHTAVPGVRVITAGDVSKIDPHVALASDRFATLVSRLRLDYRTILIDSPPIGLLPDARLIARRANAVVLVCRAGQTTLEQIAGISRVLKEDGTRVFGTILNEWNPTTANPAYYRAYTSYMA